MQVWTPIRRELGWLVLFSLAVNVLILTLPLHLMAIYDRVLVSGSVETLAYVTPIALGALGLLGIGEAVRLVLVQRAAARLALREVGLCVPAEGGGTRDLISAVSFTRRARRRRPVGRRAGRPPAAPGPGSFLRSRRRAAP